VQEAEEGRCPFPPLPLLPRSFLHFPFLSLAAVMAVVFVLLFLCFFYGVCCWADVFTVFSSLLFVCVCVCFSAAGGKTDLLLPCAL
jgi:hypothetical protein